MVVYTVLFAATTLFLLSAAVKWFRELRTWSLPGHGESGSVR
jgi:hypothetical protein